MCNDKELLVTDVIETIERLDLSFDLETHMLHFSIIEGKKTWVREYVLFIKQRNPFFSDSHYQSQDLVIQTFRGKTFVSTYSQAVNWLRYYEDQRSMIPTVAGDKISLCVNGPHGVLAKTTVNRAEIFFPTDPKAESIILENPTFLEFVSLVNAYHGFYVSPEWELRDMRTEEQKEEVEYDIDEKTNSSYKSGYHKCA